MKILYLCTFYHRARIFRDAMDHLAELGHTVHAFNAVPKGEPVDDRYRDTMDDAVTHVECFSRCDRYLYHLKQMKIYHALVSRVDVKQYDLIHSHTLLNGGYVAHKVARLHGVPYVVSVRNTDLNIFLRLPGFTAIARKIVAESSGVHFLSRPYKERFLSDIVRPEERDIIHRKSSTITNGLEPFWMQHLGDAKHIADGRRVRLLSVGNIDRNKNHLKTVEAMTILRSRGYDPSLTVVGPVIDAKVVRHLSASTSVEVQEFMTKERLIDVYRGHDIYVMPSKHESFGRVYAEAMTQGLPVIYSRGQGFDGLFEDGCVGYSVDGNDAAQIADRVIRIVGDYSRISERCIQYADMFNWATLAQRLEQFYFDALGFRREGE